jgi:FG-GAP-like repeat
MEGEMTNRVILNLVAIGSVASATLMAPMARAQAPQSVMGVSCTQIEALGIDKQMNRRAAAIRVGCGLEGAGVPAPAVAPTGPAPQAPPLAAPANVDVITGAETYPHVTQSESMVWSSDGTRIVVGYNDSINASSSQFSGVSYSTNGGSSWTRILPSPFASGHGSNFGDPILVYNAKLATWFAGDLTSLTSGAGACGAQGIGLWTSTNGTSWIAGACAHIGGSDDRESMWVDNTPTSPFYGRMYISWNDFSVGGGALYVTHSDDGTTWTPVQVKSTFIRDVQITGGPDGTVFVAAMDEGGGGFNNRTNIIYRSTNGGVAFSPITMGAPFAPPGDSLCSTNSYFAQITPIWRHMGWGQPGVGPGGVVHYAFAGKGAGADTGDIFYTRSTDNGVTWSSPIKLNQDIGTQAQWMPSLSVTASGEVFAYWYDRRNTTDGVNYEIFGRRSTDNGVSFQPDAAVSTVLIPQPLQPDTLVQACYAGDYNYSTAFGNTHYAAWTDGRVSVAGNPQQDVFFAAITSVLVASHDFNDDGKSDIAWRNTNGDVAIWLMNGTQVLSAPDIGNVPTSWSIVGQRQLNNSGYADLIWRNTNGDLAIWFMNGTQVVSTPGLGNVPTSWSIAGTSAYSATKGYAELIWRNTGGDVAIWEMNGTQVLSAPDIGNVPTNWTIVGTGDFNGDGNTDILWRNTAGDVAIWFMNGTQVVSTPGLGNVPTSWAIVGTGDFNGDGKTDILWRNTNGDVAIWLMNGTQVLSSPDIGNVPTNWSIAETGDFSNGDGKTDILWRDTAGDVAIWFMNGTQVVSTPGLGNVPTSWTIQGANAD